MTKIPQELLDKYRCVNVEYESWWEFIYEQEKEELAKLGFEATDFQFSGFWCQGDGASFTGCAVDLDKFWAAFDPDPNKYSMLRKAENLNASLYRRGSMYSHECTVYASVEAEEWQLDYGEEDPLKDALYEVWNKQLDEDIELFTKDFQTFMRDRMQTLYRKLEKEYEYLTSDEQVAEWIEANASEELEELEDA